MNTCPECNRFLGSAGHREGCSKSGLSPVASDPLLALRLRNAIADKETCIACANHDTAKFGEWQCDWSEGMRIAQDEVDKLLAQIDKANAGSEGLT